MLKMVFEYVDVALCCCGLGIASIAKLLKKIAWLLHQIRDKALAAARDSSEVAWALNRRCYHLT